MSVVGITVFRYSLALRRPLDLAGQTLTRRQGLILKLRAADGRCAHGEIAPLPGFSPETLDEAQAQLLALVTRDPNRPLKQKLSGFDARTWYALAPSVRCGLSMAMRGYLAQEAGVLVYEKLGGRLWDRVAVCGLLTGPMPEVVSRAKQLAAAGYCSTKLKVGREDLETDIRRVAAARETLGAGIALRLDANRAWDFAAALRFAERVREYRIEYIEEPLQDPRRLPNFTEQSGLDYAVDESIAPVLTLFYDVARGALARGYLEAQTTSPLHDRDTIAHVLRAARAVVIKPTLVGDYGGLVSLARELQGHGLQWIVSSCFESGLGLAAWARLAACLGPDAAPAGLDTYEWLAEDIVAEPFAVTRGELDLMQVDAVSSMVDETRLSEVYRA